MAALHILHFQYDLQRIIHDTDVRKALEFFRIMSSKGLAPDAHATLLLGLSLAGHIISNVHMALLPLVYLLFFFNMVIFPSFNSSSSTYLVELNILPHFSRHTNVYLEVL